MLLLSWSAAGAGAGGKSAGDAQRQEIPCSDCIMVARLLETALDEIEKLLVPVHARAPGRHNQYTRSELKIYDAIDRACGALASHTHEEVLKLRTECDFLVQEHRDALEEIIFKEGPAHVRRHLCSELTHSCPIHALYDDGGL